jgi:uncharacterized protein YqeY
MGNPSDQLTARLRVELRRALKARDAAGIAAVRSLLSALDNAAAQPAAPTTAAQPAVPTAATSADIAGAVPGLGAADVPRRELTPTEVGDIMAAEIAIRQGEAAALDAADRDLEAALARYQAKLLSRFQDDL